MLCGVGECIHEFRTFSKKPHLLARHKPILYRDTTARQTPACAGLCDVRSRFRKSARGAEPGRTDGQWHVDRRQRYWTDFVPARSSIRCNAMLLQPTFHYVLTCAVPLAVSAGSSPQRDPHNRSSDHVSRTVWRNSTVWPPQGCRFSCCV